jgi:DNA repair exonuclease SbcCD ATPase subunit
MYSGLQIIGSMDDVFARAQQQTGALHGRLNELSGRLLQVQKEEGEAYRDLAAVRLGHAEKDPLIMVLEQVDANVRAARQRRDAVFAEANSAIAALEREATALKEERAVAAAAAEARHAALVAAEEEVRRRLGQTDAYRTRAEATQQAERIAAAAEAKTEQAETDRREKGRAYEGDELFQYLWKRGYGTAEYHAGPLSRLFDGWIARFIGFREARASFAMLNEIPRRLGEHAQRRRAQAVAERERLAALEAEALQDGEAAARRAELAEAEARLDAVDDRIEANAAALIEAETQRARVLSGQDPAFRAALNAVEEALRRQDLRALRAHAQRTAPSEDDAAVQRLELLEAEEQALSAELEEVKAEQERQRRQLEEVGSLRRDYRRRGYHRGTFDAAAGAMLGSVLGQVLGGAISRDDFWGEVSRHHHPPGGGGWGGGWSGGGGGGGGDFDTGGGF